MRYSLALLMGVNALAQVVTGVFDASSALATRPFRQVTATPTGPCFSAEGWRENVTDGKLYRCYLGLWTEFSSGSAGSGVTSFNSRQGLVTFEEGDGAPFYPLLSGTYDNPSWITSLAASKVTGLFYQSLRVNSGSNLMPRQRLNLVAGDGIAMATSDDSQNGESVITVSSAGGGGGGGGLPVCTQSEAENGVVNTCTITPERWREAFHYRIPQFSPAYANMVFAVNAGGNGYVWRPSFLVRQNGGSALAPRQHLNLVAGTNVTVHCVDDSALDSTSCTVAAAGGGGGGSGITQRLYVTACDNTVAGAAFSFPAANAPTKLCDEGANTLFGAVRFTENNQFVQGMLALPTTFSGATLVLTARTPSTSGNSVFSVQTACVGPGEQLGTGGAGGPTFNTEQLVPLAAPGTARELSNNTPLNLTITGCAARELLLFRLSRHQTTTTTNPELISASFEVQ
jgi:hypothetical protein